MRQSINDLEDKRQSVNARSRDAWQLISDLGDKYTWQSKTLKDTWQSNNDLEDIWLSIYSLEMRDNALPRDKWHLINDFANKLQSMTYKWKSINDLGNMWQYIKGLQNNKAINDPEDTWLSIIDLGGYWYSTINLRPLGYNQSMTYSKCCGAVPFWPGSS